MPYNGQVSTDEEIRTANREGLRGGLNGAARWGLVTGALGLAAYFYSPVYRSLTFQFKVFLQMSGMTLGGMIEAERRVRDFETHARRRRKFLRDQEIWQRYEADFEKTALGSERNLESDQ